MGNLRAVGSASENPSRSWWAMKRERHGRRIGFLLLVLLASLPAAAEPLTLRHAVELALIHSPVAAQYAADEKRADASLREARNQYVPQLMVGSGLGETWGYPLSLEGSAPSLFNFTSQSTVFNMSLRDYIHAARSELKASQFSGKDQHNQIVHDTVLAYLELAKWEQLIPQLHRQREDAQHTEDLVLQRVQEGIGSPQLRNQARLANARANLHIAQAEGAVHELRALLSQLTGLPAESIEVSSDSAPGLPEPQLQPETVRSAASSAPSVLFAEQHALAQDFKARAEHRAFWPTADFATQYAVLAKFNNWLQFFPTHAFERNNATIGVVLRLPLFNASQKAHADSADAEAVRARKDVDIARNQVSQQLLKAQDSVRQLTAAKQVSDLEYEIAKANVDAVDVRLDAGTATIPEAATTRVEMFEKYNAAQDSDFALTRARVGLLRLTGDLDSWVQSGP
jgi:outer membrane protein TolC